MWGRMKKKKIVIKVQQRVQRDSARELIISSEESAEAVLSQETRGTQEIGGQVMWCGQKNKQISKIRNGKRWQLLGMD